MDVSGIKSAQLNVTGALAGEIDEAEKSKVANQQEDISHSEKIIEELGARYNRESAKKTKPQLNGNLTGKQHDDKAAAKRMSINELFSRLSDNLFDEQVNNSDINESIKSNILKSMWSPQKENVLNKEIDSYASALSELINELCEYYFDVFQDQNPDHDDIRMFFSGAERTKINGKNDFEILFKSKVNIDGVNDVIAGNNTDCNDSICILSDILDSITCLPKVKNKVPIAEPEKINSLKFELNMLRGTAEILSSAKECLFSAQTLINMNDKNTSEYNNSLAVLMGKLADLRDQIAQQKLDNDRELARLQQLALQVKTDTDAAEITAKIKKAEFLQTLFKWLGPLITAIMAVLTVITGGLLAKALVAVIVIMTIISEIVKAAGGPDIMAKVMEPVTKLVQVIQKFIKDVAMVVGKAAGKSPEELKKLEKAMEIVAMVMAVIVVAALFMAVASAIGAIAGQVTAQVASEAMQAAIKSFFAQIQAVLINMMMSSTIVNGISSVTNGVLQADITRYRADMDTDLVLLDRITELMNQIMETFSESQKDLIALNEKVSKYGNESFQRMKSMLQQGQLAV
ncbi:YopB/SseC family type III secretion system translocon subunit [Morganella morganii]|uniref:hypothetical protein n=1 Tax=Morganella morganii TaxID=582 RepID=UPI0015F6E73A|nr:hypothetical protein [Morganella morganii]MBA5807520.1 YopB/SseC family type III secretion system translocon subunit [Morganella morganii]